MFRLCLQHILLKTTAEWVFDEDVIVSTTVIACSRIIFTAIAFALAHTQRELSPPLLVPKLGATFIAGLLTSTIQEITNNTVYPILFHIGWNFTCKNVHDFRVIMITENKPYLNIHQIFEETKQRLMMETSATAPKSTSSTSLELKTSSKKAKGWAHRCLNRHQTKRGQIKAAKAKA